ncbi:15437_t:CDS:2, partial [Racocetra persica]
VYHLNSRLQKAAADRDLQRKELRNLKKQRKRQSAEQNPDDDIVIMVPTQKTTTVDNSEETPTVIVNSEGSDGKTTITRIKRPKDKASADSDTDGSVDLDALIAEGSDLDSNAIQLNDDGLDDGDDSFWKIDPAELEKHLSPSTTPLRRPSPDPQITPTFPISNRPVSMIAEEDENLSDTPLEID